MKIFKNTIQQTKILLVAALLSVMTLGVIAQPPPPPTGDPGSPENQANKLGGNANIGGGVLILLTLGLAYGGKRLYDLRKERKEEVA